VGFRVAAERTASALGLTGWVRNLDDGRVEVVCEGRESELRKFIARIDGIFGRYIGGADVEWPEATGEFTDFGIIS
jgi:acylphosphatase